MSQTSKLRKKLTTVFNKYIRMRDVSKGCISCTTGRVENAGHFMSRGSQPKPSMAFNERNVHGQCIQCNFRLGGNLKNYEKGLIRRLGPEVIRNLEITASMRHNPWTIFEYETMIKFYQDKIKKMEAQNG